MNLYEANVLHIFRRMRDKAAGSKDSQADLAQFTDQPLGSVKVGIASHQS